MWHRFGHSELVTAAKLQLIRTFRRWGQPLSELLLPERGGRSRKREQVAAVCYRVRKFKIQFLLVRTRKGRWTFPKGGVVRGLTRAQSAALEAFEEAGVHGRIEEAAFARYVLRKRTASDSESEITTHAHLCEVVHLGPPQESNRNPTWFSPEKAQLHLKDGRAAGNGAELARVIDRAMTRLQRLALQRSKVKDQLQTVKFEASNVKPNRLIARVALMPYFDGGTKANSSIIEFNADAQKVFRLGPARNGRT